MQEKLTRLFDTGTTALTSGHYENAADAFARVLEIDPGRSEAHVNLGFSLLGMQQFLAARSEFNLARKNHPELANVYYGLAIVHDHEKETDQAVMAMQTFLRLADKGHPFVAQAKTAIREWHQIQESGPDS